jgi:hypothetical protein
MDRAANTATLPDLCVSLRGCVFAVSVAGLQLTIDVLITDLPDPSGPLLPRTAAQMGAF